MLVVRHRCRRPHPWGPERLGRAAFGHAFGRRCRPPRSWIRSPPLVPAAPAGGLIRPLSWRLSPSPSASGSSSTRWPDAPSGSGEAGHPAPSRRSFPAPGRSRQGRRKPSPVKKLSGWTTRVPRGRGAPTERAGLSARSGFSERVRRFWCLPARWRSQGKRKNSAQNRHLPEGLGEIRPIDPQDVSDRPPNPIVDRKNENAAPGVGSRNGAEKIGSRKETVRRDRAERRALASALTAVLDGGMVLTVVAGRAEARAFLRGGRA